MRTIRIDGVDRKILVQRRMPYSWEENGGNVVRLVLDKNETLSIAGYASRGGCLNRPPDEIEPLSDDMAKMIAKEEAKKLELYKANKPLYVNKRIRLAALHRKSQVKLGLYLRPNGTFAFRFVRVQTEPNNDADRADLARKTYRPDSLFYHDSFHPILERYHRETEDNHFIWCLVLGGQTVDEGQTVEIASACGEWELRNRDCIFPLEENPVELRRDTDTGEYEAIFEPFVRPGSSRLRAQAQYPKRIIRVKASFRNHNGEEKLMVEKKLKGAGVPPDAPSNEAGALPSPDARRTPCQVCKWCHDDDLTNIWFGKLRPFEFPSGDTQNNILRAIHAAMAKGDAAISIDSIRFGNEKPLHELFRYRKDEAYRHLIRTKNRMVSIRLPGHPAPKRSPKTPRKAPRRQHH